MFQEAAEQQAAHLLHGVLRREGDGCGQVALPAAPLYLAQEVLRRRQWEVAPESPQHLIGRPNLPTMTSNTPTSNHASTASLTQGCSRPLTFHPTPQECVQTKSTQLMEERKSERARMSESQGKQAQQTWMGLKHLHIVILDVVVGQRLQEGLGVVSQRPFVGAEAGLAGGGAPGRAAVVLVFLLVVAVVDLAGLQASREDG